MDAGQFLGFKPSGRIAIQLDSELNFTGIEKGNDFWLLN
jgi:hypothetical protein